MKTVRSSGRRRGGMGVANRAALIRQWLILGFSVATAILVVGCGNSSHPQPPSKLQASAETEETTTPPRTEEVEVEPGESLSTVGTLTVSDGEGTTFSDRYRIRPLLYSSEGAPPDEVLNACNLTDSAEIATSVFARGEVAITYQEGSLPTEVSLGEGYGGVQAVDKGEEYGEGQLDSAVAFHVGGEWWCADTGGAIEFQEGESRTIPIWVIVSRVLSNAQPRLPKSVLNTWYFEEIGPPLGIEPRVITSGPGAATCKGAYGSEEQLLFLYNRSGSC